MPVKFGKISEVPKRGRKSVSRFEKTPEWATLKRGIDKRLGVNEAGWVEISPEKMAAYKIKRVKTAGRFVLKYVRSLGLKYTVVAFHNANGDAVIAVENKLH